MLQWTNTTSVISKWGTSSPFLLSVILFSMFASNFIVSGVKSSRYYPVLLLNVIPFPILFADIIIEGLSIIYLFF